MRYLVLSLLIGACFSRSATADIKFRSFSSSEAIGPPALAFAAKVREASDGSISFSKIPGLPQIPAQFSGDIIAAVAAGASKGGFDAAYVSGSELNKTWGFLYNSGVPFGPTFDEYLGFLYGPGLPLAQEALATRGVIAFPIVGGSEQLSGYFSEPIGDTPGRVGIGLAGLCQRPWILRYLPPGETVLQTACETLRDNRQVDKVRLSFVQSVPGSGSLVQAVASGKLNGFEFATPVDDVSQLFTGGSTPATVGLKYVHTPAWHQQFLITWFVIKSELWASFSEAQKLLIRYIAADNLLTSYAYNLRRQGAALQVILDSPGMIAAEWPVKDLTILRAATERSLDAKTKDLALSSGGGDRTTYVNMLEAFRAYMKSNLRYIRTTRKLLP